MKGEYMKVGFIGAGNMATAMIGGMLQKGLLQAEDIIGVLCHAEDGRQSG